MNHLEEPWQGEQVELKEAKTAAIEVKKTSILQNQGAFSFLSESWAIQNIFSNPFIIASWGYP